MNLDQEIQSHQLASLVGALGSAAHVQECVACIHRMGGTINLGTAVARSELLRVYRRRERGRLRKGFVVAGGREPGGLTGRIPRRGNFCGQYRGCSLVRMCLSGGLLREAVRRLYYGECCARFADFF